jgi:hypothetical protein
VRPESPFEILHEPELRFDLPKGTLGDIALQGRPRQQFGKLVRLEVGE